jgi:hypothetical protein
MKLITGIICLTMTLISVLSLAWLPASGQQPPAAEQERIRAGERQDDDQPRPPHKRGREGEPGRRPVGREAAPAAFQAPTDTGGPDGYGYTWDDTHPFSWIDARILGSNSGLYGGDEYTGPVNIGFSFPFYENTFSQLYFSTKGLLSFDYGTFEFVNTALPFPPEPNNIIVPFWYDLGMYNGGSRPTAGIYTYSGGSAPNRYFVIEWYRADEYSGDGNVGYENFDLTFEAILYENGNIVFQYQTMNGPGNATIGIEDAFGEYGLQYYYSLATMPNKAIKFTYPGPAARLRLSPQYQGGFTSPGSTESYTMTVTNIGELGSDVFDILVNSPWALTLYEQNGVTALMDNDLDGTLDTGLLPQGGSKSIIAKVQSPNDAEVGDYNQAELTYRSSLNLSKSRTVNLQGAIPAPFAQVFMDEYDGVMSLDLIQPGGQKIKPASDINESGDDQVVIETVEGNFLYAWTNRRCVGIGCNFYIREIYYTILDKYGVIVKPLTMLVDHASSNYVTNDYDPVLAAAPDGHLAILWRQRLLDASANTENYNMWLAIMNSSGEISHGPVNLTNNSIWGDFDDLNVPRFYSPSMAATGDNRFALAWQRDIETNLDFFDDIYTMFVDTSGSIIAPVAKFTNDLGPGYYANSNLASLTGNRVLLSYSAYGADWTIAYAALSSSGTVIRSQTLIGLDGVSPDAVQLTGGQILLAWINFQMGQVEYSLLDGTTLNSIAGPVPLDNPAGYYLDNFCSVTADGAGHGIITWSTWSDYRPYLFYALINSNGSLATPGMILHTSQDQDYPYLATSSIGFGNTTYSTIPLAVDGFVDFPGPIYGALPGNAVGVPVNYGNLGGYLAGQVVITATLDANLSYLSDSSGVTPSASGNELVWNMPDLAFNEQKSFVLTLGLASSAALGQTFPITVEIGTAGTDAALTNNTDNANVMAARQVYLPLVRR